MRIAFWKLFGAEGYVTNTKPITTDRSINFYIAGMRPNSIYVMRHEVLDEQRKIVEYGPWIFHRTGRLPDGVSDFLPYRRLIDRPDHQTGSDEKILLFSAGRLTDNHNFPIATNIFGQVVWYVDDTISEGVSYQLFRPVKGGTFLGVLPDESGLEGQILREIDLAGHTVRETSARRIREQLMTYGQEPFWAFHHEALRLPNGHTAVIGSVERVLEDVQGDGFVDILGDYIVVLEENWQVVWAWNSFHHLDVTRRAILDEKCWNSSLGCPPLFFDNTANDWLHSNSITYSPADGNLLLCVRNQDWIIKIDYRNGTGSGEVVWRLGPEGDFSIASGDPSQWFTHPHDSNYTGENQLVVFDNGNTRCHDNADLCFSRGQVYVIDETGKMAYLSLNTNLGSYCPGLGSAQPLLNGNFHFNSGVNLKLFPLHFYGTSTEVLPDGTPSYSIRLGSLVYRSFRMRDLYSLPGN